MIDRSDPEDEYEDTGRLAELHPFMPSATRDLCLHRMAEGYICASPRANPIHRPLRCTHGGDCPVHPDVQGLHDFTPTAYEVLAAVLAAVRRGPVDENAVRAIAAELGVTMENL